MNFFPNLLLYLFSSLLGINLLHVLFFPF
uniref:Uncharacterized protein n=1 Tax=Arundo donax TaxID=35708 RepID=A0A0A8ZYQ0_ARUDO